MEGASVFLSGDGNRSACSIAIFADDAGLLWEGGLPRTARPHALRTLYVTDEHVVRNRHFDRSHVISFIYVGTLHSEAPLAAWTPFGGTSELALKIHSGHNLAALSWHRADDWARSGVLGLAALRRPTGGETFARWPGKWTPNPASSDRLYLVVAAVVFGVHLGVHVVSTEAQN